MSSAYREVVEPVCLHLDVLWYLDIIAFYGEFPYPATGTNFGSRNT